MIWRKSVPARFLGAVIMAFVSAGLSVLFRQALGAPNYGLGVVIGVTLACYLFGLWPGVLCLVCSIAADGLLLHIYEPGRLSVSRLTEESARIITIIVTCVVAGALVVLVQQAQRRLAGVNRDLRSTQEQLARTLAQERRIAGTIQQAFLPQVPDRIDGIWLAAAYVPGSEEAQIGGDFYDVIALPGGRVAIAIGDVSGKGIEAARQAVTARYGLRSYLREIDSPAQCLSKLNDLLLDDRDFEGFVTLFVGVVDSTAQEMVYCTGGHVPALMLKSGESAPVELPPNGDLVGAVPDSTFADARLSLGDGDLLMLLSDGLTEANGPNGRLDTEGVARVLTATLAERGVEDVRAVLGGVFDSVMAYAGGQFADDATAVLLRVEREC